MSTKDVGMVEGKRDGKYEVRYWYEENGYQKYRSEETDSWLRFLKLRLTKDVIYYKVKKN